MTTGGPSLRRSLQYVRHRPARWQPRIRRKSSLEEAAALVTTMAEIVDRAAISAMTALVAAACVAAEPPLRQAEGAGNISRGCGSVQGGGASIAAECGAWMLALWRGRWIMIAAATCRTLLETLGTMDWVLILLVGCI